MSRWTCEEKVRGKLAEEARAALQAKTSARQYFFQLELLKMWRAMLVLLQEGLNRFSLHVGSYR
jgi:hypothetical protein